MFTPSLPPEASERCNQKDVVVIRGQFCRVDDRGLRPAGQIGSAPIRSGQTPYQERSDLPTPSLLDGLDDNGTTCFARTPPPPPPPRRSERSLHGGGGVDALGGSWPARAARNRCRAYLRTAFVLTASRGRLRHLTHHPLPPRLKHAAQVLVPPRDVLERLRELRHIAKLIHGEARVQHRQQPLKEHVLRL